MEWHSEKANYGVDKWDKRLTSNHESSTDYSNDLLALPLGLHESR